MTADITDFIALGLFMVGIGFVSYCMAPTHWQTPLGFLLIVIGIVPAGLLVLTLLAKPAILIPVVFVMGALMASRRRAS